MPQSLGRAPAAATYGEEIRPAATRFPQQRPAAADRVPHEHVVPETGAEGRLQQLHKILRDLRGITDPWWHP
jgi:hypothetical protein